MFDTTLLMHELLALIPSTLTTAILSLCDDAGARSDSIYRKGDGRAVVKH